MIEIHVVSRGGAALEVPLTARFGDSGGDIGRAANCTLVLPDPERRISRRQLMIESREGRHFVRQVGAGLTVQLDGAPLTLGVEYAITAGAEIRIGPYLLRCWQESAIGTAAPAAQPAVRYALPPTVDPLESVFAHLQQEPPDAAPAHEFDLIVGDSSGFVANHSAAAPDEPPVPTEHDRVAALYAGLGLPAPAASSAEQLELIGALLRKTVEGTLELLAARSIAKRELGASRTLLQTRENNPLKFSPNAHVALSYLLAPPQRGFVDPLAAVAEAFDNLRAHEVAVLAGMRAALDEVLARFDPAAVERETAPKPMWETLLPANRKAKLWDDYVERYAQITRALGGDFDALFGRAFLQAYQQQLAQLAQAPSDPEAR